jgi:hypothetical protein
MNTIKYNTVIMNTVNKITRFMMAAVIILMTSCNELPHVQTPTDNIAPPPLTVTDVKSLPGGGRITYKLPDSDNDISYVKAEYTYNGELRVERTSIYCDSLIIEGINSTEPLSVNLYVVDHSQNVSEPAHTSITPDTPPIETVFNSIILGADFGGIKVTWTNETATEIGFTVFVEDSLGTMQEVDTRFFKDIEGEWVFRGYDPVEYHFAIRIMDKWGNVSELKEARITPLFEKALEKEGFFSSANLPGDNTSIYNNQAYRAWFDDNINTIWVSDITDFSWSYPMYVSIDMGVTAKLSRFRLWGQPCCYYNNYGFRIFEVWGATEVKRDQPESYWTSGYWQNDWVKIGDYELKRPSGIEGPTGSPTGIDLEAARNGWEFLVSLDSPPCRYLRFVVHTIWSAGTGLCMAEITVWGDDGF